MLPSLRWNLRRIVALSAAVSFLALAASASAQTQVETAPGVNDEMGANNDIVVTARKTSERIQDVPVSITAVTGDELRDRGASGLQDVLRSIPGLSNGNAERGLSRYTIRGVANSGVSAPTVGIYLDDISLVTIATTFSGGLDPIFFDMQRVEVLKGPQGTLYGGSAMGGAIKYVSARPDLERIGGTAAAGLATTHYGALSYTGEGVLNLPLVPGKLALRAGGYYRRDGGYIDAVPGEVQSSGSSSTPFPNFTPLRRDTLSTRTRKDINRADLYVLRGSMEWQPDETWTIRPQAFYQDADLQDNGHFFVNRPRFQSSFRIAQPNHDRAGIYSLSIDKDLGGITATSLTAYYHRKFDYVRDYSFFVGSLVAPLYPLTSANISASRTKTFSQELRLASDPQARLRWLVGGYYSDQDDRLVQSVDTAGAAAVLGADRLYFGDVSTDLRQYALFGEATLGLTDHLDVTAGARIFKIKQTVDALNDGPLNGGLTQVTGRRSDEDGINPKVGLSYKATRDNLLFASAAKGFRPGGPNRYPVSPTVCGVDLAAIGLDRAPETFGSDNLWTYEAGTKNLFGQGRLTLNASAYVTKWKDIQQPIGLACGFGFTTNIGKAEVKGFEVEGRVALTRGFEIGGNAAYTRARITHADPSSGAKDGDAVPEVPKWSASAFVGYAAQIDAVWGFDLRAEYQYQGKALYYFTDTLPAQYPGGEVGLVPNPSANRPSYDVVNVFASIGNNRTKLRLYVNNLFDAHPLLDYDVVTGADKALTIRPRTIGVEFRQGF